MIIKIIFFIMVNYTRFCIWFKGKYPELFYLFFFEPRPGGLPDLVPKITTAFLTELSKREKWSQDTLNKNLDMFSMLEVKDVSNDAFWGLRDNCHVYESFRMEFSIIQANLSFRH